MKKYTPIQLIRLLFPPALTVLIGLVLLLSPDRAAALLSKILGWTLLLVALTEGMSIRSRRKNAVIRTVIFALFGLWLLSKPLSLFTSLGRILGLGFFGWGVNNLRRQDRSRVTPGLVAAGAVTILGLVLFLVPMSATRLVLNIAGIVIIGIGVADGFDRFKDRKALDELDDPNIIDVEKL